MSSQPWAVVAAAPPPAAREASGSRSAKSPPLIDSLPQGRNDTNPQGLGERRSGLPPLISLPQSDESGQAPEATFSMATEVKRRQPKRKLDWNLLRPVRPTRPGTEQQQRLRSTTSRGISIRRTHQGLEAGMSGGGGAAPPPPAAALPSTARAAAGGCDLWVTGERDRSSDRSSRGAAALRLGGVAFSAGADRLAKAVCHRQPLVGRPPPPPNTNRRHAGGPAGLARLSDPSANRHDAEVPAHEEEPSDVELLLIGGATTTSPHESGE